MTLRLLVAWARLLTRDGRLTEAARLAGLVKNHPDSTASLHQRGLAKLIRELQAVLPADELVAAMAQGRTLDPETAACEQWTRLENGITDG